MSSDVGLSRDAEVVYRAMLCRARWRIDQLQDAVAVPAADVPEHLRQLISDGLVVNSADQPDAYRAVEPVLALPELAAKCFRRSDDDAVRTRFGGINELIKLQDRCAELRRETREPRGLDAMAVAVERIVTRATSRVTMLLPRYAAGAVEFSKHLAEAVLRRNAELRQVWAVDFASSGQAAEHARWLHSKSAGPRFVPRVPVRAVLVDRSAGVVLDEHDNVRVERDECALSELLATADHLWDQGVEPRQPVAVCDGQHGTERLPAVLRLLAEGHTDDAVARRLGVSVRTIRNDVAATMRVLEARSRFQAGVTAARLGLI